MLKLKIKTFKDYHVSGTFFGTFVKSMVVMINLRPTSNSLPEEFVNQLKLLGELCYTVCHAVKNTGTYIYRMELLIKSQFRYL